MAGNSGGGLAGLPGRLLSGALVLLLAAWAISAAVEVISAIWAQLVLSLVVLAAAGLAANWWRMRR